MFCSFSVIHKTHERWHLLQAPACLDQHFCLICRAGFVVTQAPVQHPEHLYFSIAPALPSGGKLNLQRDTTALYLWKRYCSFSKGGSRTSQRLSYGKAGWLQEENRPKEFYLNNFPAGGGSYSLGGNTPSSTSTLTAWQRCSEEGFRHLRG